MHTAKNHTIMRDHSQPDGSGFFLTGTILLANLDYNGLLDYALKAMVGGAIWFVYKLSAEYINRKRNKDK
jgi:hypothetical protein